MPGMLNIDLIDLELLRIIRENDGSHLNEIFRKTRISKGAFVKRVDKLVDYGLVRKEAGKGQRIHLYITEIGKFVDKARRVLEEREVIIRAKAIGLKLAKEEEDVEEGLKKVIKGAIISGLISFFLDVLCMCLRYPRYRYIIVWCFYLVLHNIIERLVETIAPRKDAKKVFIKVLEDLNNEIKQFNAFWLEIAEDIAKRIT